MGEINHNHCHNHSCSCCSGHCHEEHGEKNELLSILAGAGIFAAAYALTCFAELSSLLELVVLIAAYIFLGGEVIWGAVQNIKRGKVFNESFLMTISGIGAFATGSYTEAAAVMLLYRIGEYLQEKAVGRSEREVSALLDIRPDTACVLREDKEVTVKAEDVGVGEIITVRPGERIPLDGVITEGSASIDLSALTGESVPEKYKEGETVLSGGINLNGVLKIKVQKPFSESTAAKIIDMVENAAAKKAPSEKFITTFARYYTPAVVIFAALLAVIPSLFFGKWQEWLSRSLVFLVISCPCALVISVPLAYFGGIGAASSKGILVKGSSFLDALVKLDTVIFDKTGTLTEGRFKVTKIIPANGYTENEVLSLAAQAEFFSNHPIALSIKNRYGKEIDSSVLSGYTEISGRGVKVRAGERKILAGNRKAMEEAGVTAEFLNDSGTVVYVAADGMYAGAVLIADEIKKDAGNALEKLKKSGIKKLVMLTGDNEKTAREVAEKLMLDEYHSNLLPAQKLEISEQIKSRQPKGKTVAFVGDGINDAPVLAGADIGIAMGALGSDAAIEASDIVLMTDEVSKIAEAHSIAKKTRKIVVENIAFSLGIKVVFLALGALGEASMWQAVIADVGVMLMAVLNSLRVLKK